MDIPRVLGNKYHIVSIYIVYIEKMMAYLTVRYPSIHLSRMFSLSLPATLPVVRYQNKFRKMQSMSA